MPQHSVQSICLCLHIFKVIFIEVNIECISRNGPFRMDFIYKTSVEFLLARLSAMHHLKNIGHAHLWGLSK